MSLKDYELLAKALLAQKPSDYDSYDLLTQWEKDVDAIACALESDNPRFNRNRFLDACGYEVE